MPYIRQVFDKGGSCISYFICCPQTSKAAVIDPAWDWTRYVSLAKAEMVDITHVIDTHIHSDHRSGAKALAREVGARLSMSSASDVKFGFEAINSGDRIDVGNASLEVLETAGHTKESVSLVYRDRLRSELPWGIFTGDTLLVGDVGRQDLLGAGTFEQMYHSLFSILLSYDDYVEIYPSHYAGSDCGSSARISFKSISTIGYEKRTNRILMARNFDEFTKLVKVDAPTIPKWFAPTKRANMALED